MYKCIQIQILHVQMYSNTNTSCTNVFKYRYFMYKCIQIQILHVQMYSNTNTSCTNVFKYKCKYFEMYLNTFQILLNTSLSSLKN